MPNGALIVFIVYFAICLISGFIASGEGYKSNRYAGIFGLIAILCGIAAMVVCIVWKYWLGIAGVIAIYIVGLNIGGMLMRALLRKLRKEYKY